MSAVDVPMSQVITYGTGEAAITLDPVTRTLTYSNGDSRQFDDSTFLAIADVYQAEAEGVAAQVDAQTEWSLSGGGGCPEHCDALRLPAPNPAESEPTTELVPMRKRTQRGAARSAQAPGSRLRVRKVPKPHKPTVTGAMRVSPSKHRRYASTFGDRGSYYTTALEAAAATLMTPNCRDTALAIYEENQRYKSLRATTEHWKNEAKRWRDAALEEERVNGRSMRWALFMSRAIETEDGELKNAVAQERPSLRNLKIAVGYYNSLDCQNSNSNNWPNSTNPGGIATSGLTYSCSEYEQYQISLDGGLTWMTVRGRECNVSFA